MIKFKPANPDSIFPAWLQVHTKENIKFQLALTAVMFAGIVAYELYEERQFAKRYENLKKKPTLKVV